MRLGMVTADTPKESKEKGVLVSKVMPYSLAENAGISTGDIIVELDGVQVTSEEQLRQIVPGLAENTDHTITFVRDNDRMKITIKLAENTTIFTPVAPAKRGLTDINTLKYALIDSQTRIVTFVGSYDPTYATGPIPYTNILRDVLANPYPSFSLEPSANQRAEFDKVDRMISADIARMASDPNFLNQWAQNLMNLLLHDTSLTVDNKRFFKKCASEFGMTGDELKNLYAAAEGKAEMSQSDAMGLFAKLMRGVGLPDVANAMQSMSAGGTPDDVIRGICDAMSVTPQLDELQDKLKAGSITYDQFKNEGIILSMSAMCRRFGAPEGELQSKAASVRSGAQTTSVMTAYFGEQMGNFITNKTGAKIVNGLALSPELMSKMYNLPVPKSDLVCKNIPANSHLGDALFRADYLLKTLCTNPDVRDKFAGHLTDQEFLQKEAAARNYDLPAGSGVGIGNRLVPAEVKLRVSPKGDVVEFQNSQVKVISWVRELGGTAKTGAAADFVNSTTPKYGEFLTKNYDEYARAYPEWHKMSEVAKCVALARWAKSNNYTINVENASDEKVPLPRQIPGFWTAVFQTDGEKASLTVIEEGGASFSQDEGEAWLKPQQDETVASDVSKQLVASAVLAEKAVNSALGGDLEAARELADKSARAMTGDIDLNMLPALSNIPMPGEPATYAAADAEIINQASECLNTMKTAQQDLQRAQDIQASNPQEAASLRQQATQAQDNAQAKLKELLASVSSIKSNPSSAGAVVVSLRSGSSLVAPIGGVSSGGQTVAQGTTTVSGPQTPVVEDWPAKVAKLKAELEEIDKKIAGTRESLLRLSATIQADRKQYEQWEKDGEAGFDRCVNIASDVVVDFGAGEFGDRYKQMHELAEKLPDKPTNLIEKYRLIASLAARLKEAKSVNDFNSLLAHENLTKTELYETLRDGVGQIIGLLGLENKVPALKFWKYGTLAADMAYNLTELRLGWKSVTALDGNQELQREAVKKLAEQMRLLQESKKDVRTKIDAGE